MEKFFLWLALSLYITNIQAQSLYTQVYPQNKIKVVIDPGHGGKDLGCHGHNYAEKDIAFQLSRKIGAEIKALLPSVSIIYTRTSDIFMPLSKRIDLAQQYEADLFISVHANAIDIPGISGSETYVFGPHLNHNAKMLEKRENAALILEHDLPQSTTPTISDLILNASTKNNSTNESILLAESIEKKLSLIPTHKSRGVKQANFAILNGITIPCILFEAGYLTNESDLKKLSSPKGQNQIAKHLALGVQDYIRNSILKSKQMTRAGYKDHTDEKYILVVAKSNSPNININTSNTNPDARMLKIKDGRDYHYILEEYQNIGDALADRKAMIDAGYAGTYLMTKEGWYSERGTK